jgi:hypothetical protein
VKDIKYVGRCCGNDIWHRENMYIEYLNLVLCILSYLYFKRKFNLPCLHIFLLALDKSKGKAHPLQVMQAQRSLGELRLLDFLTSALYGGRLSALCTSHLYAQGHPWYSFSRGSESTPGPWFSRREICHWKIQWHDWESIPGRSD